MKKLLLTFILAVAVITAKAVTATIYVKADQAPFLYGWYTVNGKETKFNGSWPGKQLTQSVTKTNKNGEQITFWYQTIEADASAFNIIFNNGQDGVNQVQTNNISAIQSDHYFTFDETNPNRSTNYADITEDFGVEIPDVKIQSVAIKSELNWDEQVFFTEVEKNVKYTYDFKITDEELDPLEYILHFYFMVNSSAELKWNTAGLIKNDPNNWLELDPAFENNQDFSIDFSKYDVRDILFTLEFAGGKNIYEGWTLTVEEGTQGIYGIARDATRQAPRYNLSGQRISDNYRGLIVTNGKKLIMK